MNKNFRLVLTGLVLLGAFSGISAMFWTEEWKYRLPTPVPETYQPVPTGTVPDFKGRLKLPFSRPVFLHFFNPDCPCSRFNMPHVRSLVREYGDRISFAVVVLDKTGTYTAESIREKYNLDLPVYFDSVIAAACGVYSTPQAVILDEGHRLYYRGNYNKSRYCTDSKSNYAKMAIDSLLLHQRNPFFNQYALKAYGCQLPNCSK